MAESIVRMQRVNKWFGKFQVLKDIDFAVAAGEKIVICGPSGSGKSTLVRLVNGLELPQNGTVEVDGETVSELELDRHELIRALHTVEP